MIFEHVRYDKSPIYTVPFKIGNILLEVLCNFSKLYRDVYSEVVINYSKITPRKKIIYMSMYGGIII